MRSINDFEDTLKELPLGDHMVAVRRMSWARISYDGKEELENAIFNGFDQVCLSRKMIHEETDPKRKIIMTLMWGYPTGGRGNNLAKTLHQLGMLSLIMKKYQGKDLCEKEFRTFYKGLSAIDNLGMSTITKLLYFFDISIDGNRCLILDMVVEKSLNNGNLLEFRDQNWRQSVSDYCRFVKVSGEIAKTLKLESDRIELFLFAYNPLFRF